ncbi:hypothetical protein ACP70R_019568 [Stipagrostis hirtigluma subsp. patula]
MAADSTAAAAACGWEEVLIYALSYVGVNPAVTAAAAAAASAFTCNHEIIEASFSPARPPLPSRLHVRCPELYPGASSELPRVLCAAQGTILFRVATSCRGRPISVSSDGSDYFVYRVDGDRPSLRLLPHQQPAFSFRDEEVGILPRGDRHYTIAALQAYGTIEPGAAFTLHLLHSDV